MSSLRRRGHLVLVVMVLIGLFGPLVPATAAEEPIIDTPSAAPAAQTDSGAEMSGADTGSPRAGQPSTVETEVPAAPTETEVPAVPTETEVPAVPTETEVPAVPAETEVPAAPTETVEPEARSLDSAERSVLIQQAKEGGGFTIQKKVSPEIVEKNSTITYEIVVGFSDQEPGDSFTVNDSVPHQLTNVVGTCGAASGATCSGGGPGHGQVWTITPLVSTGTVYLTISAYVGDLVGQTITNNAYINNDPSLIGSNTFTVVNERPPDTEVTPGIPTVDPGSCVGGVLTLPKLNLPSTTGITYTHSALPPNGGPVFVTATAGSGYVLPPQSEMPAGWTLTDTTFFKTASYIVTFPAPVECKVSPAAPTFTEAQCTDGRLTQPKVTLPGNTAGIKYSVSPKNPTNGGTVTVTATLQNGYSWGDTSGWDVAGNKATKTHTFKPVKCEVSPATPAYGQARCENGTLTNPWLKVGPTEGVTYTWDTSKVVNGGGDVVITATLKSNDYTWGSLNGWTDNKDGTLSITVKFEKVTCAVAPAKPTITQAQCKNGIVTPPSIGLKDSAAITYDWDASKVVNGGGDVVITATLTGDDYSWQEPLLNGWTKTGDTTAQYTATFELVPCDAIPVDPKLTQAQCVNGALTKPKLTATDTDSITYSWNPADVKNGGTVVVTATLQPNYTWGDMPEGWTQDGNKATKPFTFAEEKCDPASPVNPEWEDAQCVNGALTEPTLTATDTDAITYSWDASKVVNGGTVVVTATLAKGFEWETPLPEGWKPKGTGKATFEVKFQNIKCKGVSPVNPEWENAQCVNGALTEPTLTATDTDAITYSWDASQVVNGGTVVVTATLADDYAWATPLPKGWKPKGTAQATFEVIFKQVECTPVVPVNPEWENAQCVNGALTEPTLTATDTDAIAYTWNADDVKNGGTVVVTATLADDYAWATPLPKGWKPKGIGQATFEVIFKLEKCEPVSPVDPAVVQAICSGGIITNPSVTVPANTDAIHYTKSGIGIERPGETVVVTATLQPGFAWADPLPEGWEPKGAGQATYTVDLDDPECEGVSPAPLDYEQAQCVNGAIENPVLTFDNTKGIIYSYDPREVVNGGSVTVTAILGDGLTWGDLGDWTKVNAYIATKTFTFDLVECTPVVPVDPDLTQAQCLGGTLTTPQVTFADTEGISYSYTGGLASGSTIVVTATLEKGYGWPDSLPDGWKKIDSAHARAEFTFDDVECEQVVPAAPNFENAQCLGGVLTEPKLDLQTTTGITYTTDTDPVNGGTVIVTAKLADTYGWPETLPEGWIKVDDATATYKVTYDDVSCEPALPVDPEVVNAVCVGGELTAPRVIPATTEGIIYRLDGDVVNGGTVTVIATVEDGFGWPETLPKGWEKVNDATATFLVELDNVSCIEVALGEPDVMQAQCIDGGLVPPSVTLPTTEGVTYSLDGDIVSGGTATVTATVRDSFGWPETLPAGWTKVDAATATYLIEFEDIQCTPAAPVDPDVVQATCLDGDATTPSVTAAPDGDGITYTVDPAAPHTPGQQVVVTATLADDYAWVGGDAWPAGWEQVSPTVATYTVDLDSPECPQLELDKSADTEGPVSAGDVITYAFLVTNSGNVDLTNVVVIDDHAGLVWDAANPNGEVGTLAPKASRTIYATYVVTAADVENGYVYNIAVAIGTDPNDEEVPSNEDEVEIPVTQSPGLAIEKQADPTSGVTVGDTVVYTFTVTNTGDVTLRDVVVDDPMLTAAGVAVPAVGDLAPGASKSVSATYVVTEADVEAGAIHNVATATGQGPCPPDVAGESCPVTSPPDDATVKTEKPKPAPEPEAPAGPTTPSKPTGTPDDPVTALPSTGMGPANPAASSLLLVAVLLAAAAMSAGLGLRLRVRR